MLIDAKRPKEYDEAARLLQLEGIDVDDQTRRAIEDWHYWGDQGCELG